MANHQQTFLNGMISDAAPWARPEGSYDLALNAVHSSRDLSNFGLVNEEGNALSASVNGTIVGWSHIEERNQTLLFVKDGGSALYLFDHDIDDVKFVARDTEFGCDWQFGNCEFLYGEFKSFNKCNELHVYWSSSCTYYVMNIDEMLDPTRKQAVIDCEECDYFEVFRCICGPHLSAFPVENSGSTLEGGAYHFTVELEDNDGGITNVFDISHVVYVETENNAAGEVGKNSIRLVLTGLDGRYDKVTIYVAKTVADITTFERLDSIPYGDDGITYNYYGQRGETVSISAFTQKARAYLKGQDLIQKDGRMFFYGLKNERNLNYQKYANQIGVEWLEYETSIENMEIYQFPNLMRGEVYAIGIVWKFCDGTYSPVFHIPAGNPIETGGVISGTPDIAKPDIDSYPIPPMSLDTTDQVDRKRNPDELKDRPGESDEQEEALREDIENIDTNEESLKDAAECDDCDATTSAVADDIEEVSRAERNNAELIAGYGLDDPDPELDQTSTLKDAAGKLMDDAVTNREYVVRKRPKFNPSIPAASGSGGGSLASVVNTDKNRPKLRGDNWVDSDGNDLIQDAPVPVASGQTIPFESTVDYSDAKDCDGKFFYPQTKVLHHMIPGASQRPHFISSQNGVVNKYQPENYEYARAKVRPMGLRLSGITFPSNDELPKPLCPVSPFKIVYVKRTDQNKTVFAKGYLNGIFTGDVYGTTYAFQRHGVNSKHTVDRFIATGDDGTSRKGTQSDEPIYLFNSLDTDSDKSYLPITHVRPELSLTGSGWLHGLYAEGRKPVNQWDGTKVDYRGARISNNLNHYTIASGEDVELSGIQYAKGDRVVTAIDGIDLPLMHRYRTSAVYMQVVERLAGDERDESFPGGTLDHFGPTNCNAPYVALIRELPDQYGSVESLQYIDLGLNATHVHADGQIGIIEGICGDTFIGPYSKLHTSYVSNKVGDFFNPPSKPGSPCRERSWCQSPDDKIIEHFGIDFYPTKLPKSGDKHDPKNYAGLHTVAGACGVNGLSRNFTDAAAQSDSESDFYFPRTLSGLVHTVVESHVNPWVRETGAGSQVQNRQVYYPKLKDLYLDPAAPASHPWEESYLSGFGCRIEQPSKLQLWKKALIRTIINLIIPAGTLVSLQNLDGFVDTTSFFMGFPMLAAMWVLASNRLFTDTKLNEILGIGDCRRDEEGGDLDECIEGWKDNYTKYNLYYSKPDDIQIYSAFPSNYNTCDCDDCDKKQTNNEVYYTPKQNLDSEIDAYRDVKLNSFTEIPAHAGRLTKLFVQNNALYGLTTDGIWLLKMAAAKYPTDIASQILGPGDFLLDPQLIFEGTQEGFAGTTHSNAFINTTAGAFWIDEVANKIYRFNGSPEEISAYGMDNFFKNKLGFCAPNGCYDEKTNYGVHFSLGWDPRYNRLLLTKQDGGTGDSFTISYTPVGVPTQGGGSRGKWISFHSYIPQGYFWDRGQLYSIKDGGVWKHNQPGAFAQFYGQAYPFIVQTTASSAMEFEFKELWLQTKTNKDVDATFNKMAVWNSNEGSGVLPIEVVSNNAGGIINQAESAASDPSKVKLHKVGRTWRTNGLHNLVMDGCEEQDMVIYNSGCQAISEVNQSIFNCEVLNRQDYKNRTLSDYFITYRFILDNRNDLRLHVTSVITRDSERIKPK